MQTIRLFCNVADCRSFSRAARQHGITQSAASQRVRQLEKRLGVTLIDRSVRPLTLTAAGELFLRESRELVERYDRLARRIGALGDQAEGEVRVGAIYSAGIDLLNRVQEAFQAKMPNVTVSVEYMHHQPIYDAVRGRRCDLGILSYPSDHRGLRVLPLRDELMALVCAPDHPLANRAKVAAAQLDGLSLAAFEPKLPAARHIRRYLKEAGAALTIRSVFDNVDTIKSAVAVTDQVAILPRRTVLREVAAGSLAAVTLEPPLVRPMGIVYREPNGMNSLHPVVQAFIDSLLDHAGPHSDAAISPVTDGARPTAGPRRSAARARRAQEPPTPRRTGRSERRTD